MCGIILPRYIQCRSSPPSAASVLPHLESWSPVNPSDGSKSLSSMCWPRHRQLHPRGAWVGNHCKHVGYTTWG